MYVLHYRIQPKTFILSTQTKKQQGDGIGSEEEEDPFLAAFTRLGLRVWGARVINSIGGFQRADFLPLEAIYLAYFGFRAPQAYF
jgi:hypothetical protein